MAECIHGFDDGMCDICFPRVAAEPVAVAVQPAPRAARGARKPLTVKRFPGAPAGAPAKVPPFGARRLYHATPLRNLESILLDGVIKPIAAGFTPDVDVAAPLVRELRAHAEVGDGRPVAAFVPFSASPDADRWLELRSGAEEAHWSPAARTLAAADYAVLVAVARDLGDDVVVADGDAAAAGTGFVIGDAARAVAGAARVDPELASVEVLVPGEVPVRALTLIAVANEPARARVRGMFADVEGAPHRVVVHPPWFLPRD